MAAPDTNQLYTAYKKQPTPENLAGVVKALEPTIGYALAQVGASDDPVVQAKARLYTARAVREYDPASGANLHTHVGWQLKQLSRAARQSRAPVAIPERAQLDAYHLDRATRKFQDDHGRDPDTLELADATGMPMKRIAKVRRFQYAIPAEGAMGDTEVTGPDHAREALDYVYHESDHTDRRILEHKVGYGGHPLMAPKDIAVKLNLTPAALTRRSIRMTHRINQLQASLEQQ